ncbi:MAG TPA: PEP-CTERM sorting domain-containing protein [Bryobacteraceae bacterium]
MNTRGCACLYLGMLASLPIAAFDTFDLQAIGDVSGDFFARQQKLNGPSASLTPLGESLSASGSSAGGSSMAATSSGVADYGLLRGFAGTSSTLAPGPDARAVAVSLANLAWGDTFVFTGPAGTDFITARVTLGLQGTLSTACASSKSFCQATAQINLHSSTQPALLPDIVLKEGNTDFTRLPPVREDGIVSFANGGTVQITSQLFVSSTSGPSLPGTDATSSNFTSTGFFFLDVLTPGASYTTASGRTYSASAPGGVPEPASIALLILGFTALAGRWASQRRRSRIISGHYET